MAGQSIMDRRIFGSKAVSLAIQACKGAVSVASQSSLRLCEDCGAPANQVLDRLASTLCSDHNGRLQRPTGP